MTYSVRAFALALALGSSAGALALNAADGNLYAIYKRQLCVQTNSGMPAPRCSPFVFDAIVSLTQSNSITAAGLAASDGTQTVLTTTEVHEFVPSRHVAWTCENFSTRAELDASFPDGNYTFLIFGTHDGLKRPALNLNTAAYPPAPHIRNYLEAQAVDASADFRLEWDLFEDGTTNDLVFVSVRNSSDRAAAFNTPFLQPAASLDGTASSASIPAGTLSANQEYDVYVRFDKVLQHDTDSYPGATGLSTCATGTHFTLKTTSSTANP
jgi:hypothetical protein